MDSTCALMRELSSVLTGEDESGRTLCLEGRRPLRPFRLSVRTTAEQEIHQKDFVKHDVKLQEACVQHSIVTFSDHSDGKAFLEATVLAAIPPPFVYRANLGRQTHILGIFLHCALEGDDNILSLHLLMWKLRVYD